MRAQEVPVFLHAAIQWQSPERRALVNKLLPFVEVNEQLKVRNKSWLSSCAHISHMHVR